MGRGFYGKGNNYEDCNRMKLLRCILVWLLFCQPVLSDVETIRPDADPTPDGFTLVNSTKHGALSDDSDASYLWVEGSNNQEKVGFADQSVALPADFDSIVVRIRAAKGFGGGNPTLTARLIFPNNNYCDSDAYTVTGGYNEHTYDTFNNAPSGGGTCANTWDGPRVDSIQVQINANSMASDTVYVAELYVDVYSTPGYQKIFRTATLRKVKL
jgi:hypothetical protein